MADTPQIPEWSGARLNNGQFLNYAKDVARVAATFPEGPLPIAPYVTNLNAATAKLTDFINETRKSAETAEVAAADARRDLLFRAVWSFLDYTGRLEGNDEFSRAARLVQSVVSPYKGAASHPLTKETEEIKGMKVDLERDEPVTAVMTLGLDKALTALYAANDAVDAAYTQRADSKAAQGAAHFGETTDSVRKDTLNVMFNLFRTVNAFMQLTPDSEAIRAAVIRLIQTVDQHKAVAAQNGKHQQPEGGGDGGSDVPGGGEG